MPRKHKRTWLSMLLGAVILLCGMAIGAGATLLWVRARIQHFRDADIRVEQMARRIQKRYGLTHEQTLKVAEVLRRRLHALQEIREEILPRVEAEHKALSDELRAILTPEQFERWNKDFEALRRRRLGLGQGRMRGHGPPPASSRHNLAPLPEEQGREAHEE